MTSATVEAGADHGTVHIRLCGEIDRGNASTVEEQICAAVSGQPAAVSVDLANLIYIDSVGIRLLFDLASHLQKLRIALKLIAPVESPARRLIQFSGLDSLVVLDPASS
jgi:stage II sporulation protein AA (anti-sigma F factor antagonist)